MKLRTLLLFTFLAVATASHAATVHLQAIAKGADTSDVRAKAGRTDLTGKDRLAIHFLDVKQGDGILLIKYNTDAPDDWQVIAVDCGALTGPASSAQEARAEVEDIFGDHERKIDTLLITHPHTDHYDMLPFVYSDFDISRVLLTGEASEYGKTSVAEDGKAKSGACQDWLAGKTLSVVTHESVDPSPAKSNWFKKSVYAPLEINVLAANVGTEAEQADNPNLCSIMMMVTLGDFDILLTGDSPGEVQQEVIANHKAPAWPENFLDCDVLKLAHHGSHTHESNDATWLQAVRPELAVSSASLENTQFGLPAKDTIEAVEGFTVPAPSHVLRSWISQKKTHVPVENLKDKEANYCTARMAH